MSEYYLNKIVTLDLETNGQISDKLNKTANKFLSEDLILIKNSELNGFMIDINKILEIIKPGNPEKIKIEDVSF
jgi:hypothetical protein